MITYQDGVAGIEPDQVQGFFVDWTHRPSPELFLRVMANSAASVVALDGDRLVGYINAISDGLNAFIPWLEVHPDHQGQGIGSELVRRVVAQLAGHYAIDLLCEADLVDYYERLGFTGVAGACLRFPSAIAAADAELSRASGS